MVVGSWRKVENRELSLEVGKRGLRIYSGYPQTNGLSLKSASRHMVAHEPFTTALYLCTV